MTKIKQIVYCGWRGIDYLALETDKPLNAFLGENGAGKSTLAMALIYALLPDRKVLNVRPISDIKDASVERQDSLMGRIDPEQGYAYVAMDIITRTDERLVAGIYLSINNQRLQITPFSIPKLPKEYDVYEIFNAPDGEKNYTPDLTEIKRNLAQRGYDCYGHENIGDYGKLLHDAGILPTPMYTKDDRDLFARLLETSFLGGISPEIAKNLKHYLLQEAKHIPETVRRMHECTEDVLKTQRALNEAKRQIQLVQAAFVTGRSLISNAIAYIHTQFAMQWRALEANRKDAMQTKSNMTNARKSIADQTAELEQARETEKALKGVSQTKLNGWEADWKARNEQKTIAENHLKDAKFKCDQAEEGKKAWEIASKQHPLLSFDKLETALEVELAAVQAERAERNEDVRRLRQTLDRLQRTEDDSKVAALAALFKAKTLEDQLSDVNDADARDFEASLHGMTDGIVGIAPSDLVNVVPDDELPSCFWIGEKVPEKATMTIIGRWHMTPSQGGYTVLSDTYKATFGHEARKRRIAEINIEIEAIEARSKKYLDPKEDNVKLRQRALLVHAKAIELYLAERDSLDRLLQDAKDRQDEVDNHKKEIKRIERLMREEREDLATKMERISERRVQLGTSMAHAESVITTSIKALEKLSTERAALVTSLKMRVDDMRECASFQDAYRFFNQSSRQIDLGDPATYVATQSKIFTLLAKALEGESAERMQPIATLEINHHSPAQCLNIWPVLMNILQDHVPSSMLDLDGEHLLSQMEARRDNLFRELVKKQNDVKVQARSIATSINTQITFQKRQINALSEMGRDLRFGKVEGIRITLIPKVRMIELLQKVSDDAGLFSDDSRSMDEVLAEYFKEALGERLQGSEVLDYRTFIDLKLEAKRLGHKDWVPAFSLSGGEAIGAGIAIVLMLFRALANRGDHRSDQLTPVFVMDEINRIDPRGQRMVVDLCELNGIQLFVTGPEMVPAINTRMYMLARSMDPVERVIPRELRGFAG